MNKQKKQQIKNRIINNPNMVWMIKQYDKRGQYRTLKQLGFTPEEVRSL